MSRSASAYRFAHKFFEIRDQILASQIAERLDKPLAFWQLPSDRYLPTKLMDKTLREVCEMRFEEFFKISTLGGRKLDCLLEILTRAVPPSVHNGVSREDISEGERDNAIEYEPFDVMLLSEDTWCRWQQVVRENGLADVTLGQLVVSLRTLPRALWSRPLQNYLELSLAEIRDLWVAEPQHANAVLVVFESLQGLLKSNGSLRRHLSCRVVPRFVATVESWSKAVLERRLDVDFVEVLNSFAEPLFAQLEIDAGAGVARQVRQRVGLLKTGGDGQDDSSTGHAHLLDTVREFVNVRWPHATSIVADLQRVLHDLLRDASHLRTLDSVFAFFFFTAPRHPNE